MKTLEKEVGCQEYFFLPFVHALKIMKQTGLFLCLWFSNGDVKWNWDFGNNLLLYICSASQWLSGNEFTCNVGDAGDPGSIPGSGRSLGGGHDNPFQYSCLENPVDRGTWWAKSIGSQRVRHDWSDLAHIFAQVELGRRSDRKVLI